MFTSVILAAGMGTRMKSKMPKVLHTVCGKPLSKWVIDASKAAGADKVCAVAGYRRYKKFKGRGCYSKR